jgi:hypothetical protein
VGDKFSANKYFTQSSKLWKKRAQPEGPTLSPLISENIDHLFKPYELFYEKGKNLYNLTHEPDVDCHERKLQIQKALKGNFDSPSCYNFVTFFHYFFLPSLTCVSA